MLQPGFDVIGELDCDLRQELDSKHFDRIEVLLVQIHRDLVHVYKTLDLMRLERAPVPETPATPKKRRARRVLVGEEPTTRKAPNVQS